MATTLLPTLQRASSCSYHADPLSLTDLIVWLRTEGFIAFQGRSQNERVRLRHPAGQLIVLYYSGSILVQGQGVGDTMALLSQLEVRS
jgi:hypothetical protein